MTNHWQLRIEGTTQVLDGLTAERVVDGVREQDWEPTDEVKGEQDRAWQSIETHPYFAEAIAEIEPPTVQHPDETRLDMNPLIDVALVLLIFFILTTTYAMTRKMVPVPSASRDEIKETVGEGRLREFTIRVTAKLEKSQPIVRVENEIVSLDDLKQKLIQWREKTGHSQLAVEMDKNVPWKTFLAIQDAAAGAKISQTIRIERPTPKDE